jgi:hypothetical protein
MRELRVDEDTTEIAIISGRDRDSEQYDGQKFVAVFNPFELLLQSVKYQSAAYGTPFEWAVPGNCQPIRQWK